MQLPAHQRREVVEDVLDIAIFSKMNSVLKDRMASNKEETRIIDVRVESSKKEAASQKKIIDLIEKNLSSRIAEIETEQQELIQEQLLLDESLDDLRVKLRSMETDEIVSLREQRDTISESIEDAKHSISQIKTKLSKFDKIVECPTCMQGVSHEHKESIQSLFSSERMQLQELIDVKSPLLISIIEKISDHDSKVTVLTRELDSKTQERKSIIAKIADKAKQISKLQEDTGDLDAEKLRLKDIAKSALVHITRKNELVEEKQLQEVSQILLKDNGIKTAIIREYLPVLNKLINRYLQSFDFFVNFNLDESFSEKIKSRGRDEFSYANFSEGEKRKIDLAILLSFRQIAAMKNSAKVNLLLFDEIADSSFDLDARAKFNELLMEMSGSNVFVISHTDTSPDAYSAAIKVEKKGDFSQYTYV
jgi:DNA repair exonuclease SbcCD ATPase subunit